MTVPEECSILIIDDNIDDLEAYRRMLARAPSGRYRVTEAETGEQGLQLSRQQRPDCILLDYSLPGHDGVRVLSQLRLQNPDVNVIILTGQGSESVAVEVMKNGARDYLTKDAISTETLHRCIQNAIMRGTFERQIEQKRQSLEIFTRAMAHDLKEPLRTIKSFSKILHSSQSLPRDDRELLEYILSAADHMEDLIVKVSGFTKLEASNQLDMKPVSLNTVLAQVKANLLQQIESSGTRIVHDDLPEVFGDPVMLTQLLQNLVSNAIHYSRDTTPTVTIAARSSAGFCHLTVEDNGPGIAPEHQELIFQPFKRLVGRGIEGTGLGLAICRRIMQLHGGSIWCESRLGNGARFISAIPLTRSSAATETVGHESSPERPPQLSLNGSGRLAEVLLVEDSPADVQLLKIKLMAREKVHFNLHVATNGEDALNFLQRRIATAGHIPIDLVLLDINMPIMDGFEVLDSMARDDRLKSVPVCILSTSSDEDDIQRAREKGACAYMIKPPTRQQFEQAVRGIGTLQLLPRNDALDLTVEHTVRSKGYH